MNEAATKTASIAASIAPAPPGFLPGGTGRPLGLLLLDTRFPRLPGDAGLPASWPVPVITRVVDGAWPQRVVQGAAALRAAGLQQAFVDAARALESEGVAAITTSCGFLVLFQQELHAAVRVPVVTSSLLLLPALLEQEAQVGVLTISAERLGAEHLLAAGVARERLRDVWIQGMPPASEFARAILGNDPVMDVRRAGDDVVAAACALQQRLPALRTLVLECTNMPPQAARIRAATGLRVQSLFDVPALGPARLAG